MSQTIVIIVILSLLGAISALSFLHRTAQFLLLHFWTPSSPLQLYKRRNDTPGEAYALVTGGSAGIGLGIARALLRQGFGVILLGHLPEELDSAATSLISSFNLPQDLVKTLVLNAQTATHDQIRAAVEQISPLDITILVNNVGGLPLKPPIFRPFSTLTLAEIDAHIDLNARFMIRLTNWILPILRRNERALILNVSSAARVGFPLITTYSATKAFISSFSASLSRELQEDPATAHIDCLAVIPGDVHSQSNLMAVDSAPSAEAFGASLVDTVDGAVARGWREVRPWWRHDLEIGLVERVLPDRLMTRLCIQELRRKTQVWEEAMKKRS